MGINFFVLFVGTLCLHFVVAVIDPSAQFKAYDANKDAKWDRKEAEYVLYMKNAASILNGGGFDSLDINQNGALDDDEYETSKLKAFLVSAGAPSTFAEVDTDGDDYILVLEYIKAVNNASKKQMDAIFPVADTDHDGKISLAEFTKSPALINSVCPFPCQAGDA